MLKVRVSLSQHTHILFFFPEKHLDPSIAIDDSQLNSCNYYKNRNYQTMPRQCFSTDIPLCHTTWNNNILIHCIYKTPFFQETKRDSLIQLHQSSNTRGREMESLIILILQKQKAKMFRKGLALAVGLEFSNYGQGTLYGLVNSV